MGHGTSLSHNFVALETITLDSKYGEGRWNKAEFIAIFRISVPIKL